MAELPELREEMAALQEMIRAQDPQAKFRLEPSEQEGIWHFSIYTQAGNMEMPPEIMATLDNIWRTHRVTVVTVVYPLTLFDAELPADPTP